MANTAKAVAVDSAPVVAGDDLSARAVADATADSKASTVAGVAVAAADVQEAVGVLDSTITVGGDATSLISETGVAAATATSVAAIADARAVFSGETGGFIDSKDATNVDFTAGGIALLDVQVANIATAAATSTQADASATGLIAETYGLQDIGVRVGSNGTLNATVDADVASTANSIGLPGVPAVAVPAAAVADSQATRIAAISGLGDGTTAATSDFAFGDNATITANAGTSADRVTLSASATTVGGTGDGDATATVASTAISGITAAAGSDGVVSNVLSVGADATITARAYVDGSAKAVSVAGDASASTDLAAVDGLQADTVSVGEDASLKAYANTLSAASAATIDRTATATNTLGDSRAIQLDNLTIGAAAISAGSYGVIGAASANLTTAATSVGQDATDVAQSTGSSGRLIGVQLGDESSSTADGGLSAGSNLSLAGTADLTSAASASAIAGAAEARSLSSLEVSGVVLNEAGASAIGSGGTILASGNVNLDATATNVGTAGGLADSLADATTALVQGLGLVGPATSLTIGDGGSITAAAVVAADAKATSVDAAARAVAGGGDAYGINSPGSDLTIGGAGSLNATVTNSIGASASTVAGDARAWAVPNYSEGLYSNDVSIGAGGNITAAANTTARADASSVAGSSDAITNAVTTIGFEAQGAVNVGAAGSINATATSLLQAFADSVGDDSDFDHSDASASGNDNIGFLADLANTSIGAAGSLNAAANLTTNAAASGVQADVSGETRVDRNVGIVLDDGSNARTLAIGADGTVSGSASGSTSAAARTTNGDALASNRVDLTAGLGSGDGVVTIGGNGTVNGTASAIGSAIAAAIDADGDSSYPDSDVEAIVSNGLVSGIDLGILEIGASAAITATALSSQTATASNIGDPSPLDDTTVRATVADHNAITGLDSTAVSVGTDLSKFSGGAQLSAIATASNINSSGTATDPSARASSGLGSAVIGIDDSDLSLGRNVTAVNGLRADAISTLSASASGVAGAAEATAGDAASRVIAINSSDLSVGNNANTSAVAASSLSANASSISGPASAAAAQNADGLRNSAIAIGNAGNVIGQASLVGNAAANTVGSQASPDDASADLRLLSSGIDQSDVAGATIVIGDTGNVSGSGFASGSSKALTSDGKAVASGLIQVQGIDLRSGGNSDITIDGTGNIAGLAVIGMLNGAGSLGSPVTVTATSTAGSADANGDFDAEGIAGLEDLPPLYLNPTLLIAGPERGDVSGQAMAGGQVTASNIGRTSADTATATNTLSQLFGLQNVDIVAGLTGTNLVKGTAFGDFSVNAVSVAGDSKATSNSDVYGIFDESSKGNISLSGNLNAIAQLTNKASSKSVAGQSSSDTGGEAIGLLGYEVNMISSGNLVASAFSSTESNASSVAGAARS